MDRKTKRAEQERTKKAEENARREEEEKRQKREKREKLSYGKVSTSQTKWAVRVIRTRVSADKPTHP